MSLAASLSEGLPNASVAKRNRATKATSRQGSSVASKSRKVSFYLSPEAIRRLGIAAVQTDSDKSKVLEAIIAKSEDIRRWVVQDRPVGAKPSDSAMSDTSADGSGE
jgi:hypothetical protein